MRPLPCFLSYLLLAFGTMLVVTFLLIVRFTMYPALYQATTAERPPLWFPFARPYHISPPRTGSSSSTPAVPSAPSASRPLIIPSSYVSPKTGCQTRFDIAYIYLYEKDKHIPANLERLKNNKAVHEEMINKAGRGYVAFDLSYPVVEMEITPENRRRITFLNPDGTIKGIKSYRIVEEFYKTNPDAFDFIHIFTNFSFINAESDSFAVYIPYQTNMRWSKDTIRPRKIYYVTEGPLTPIGRLLGTGRMWDINEFYRNPQGALKGVASPTDGQFACVESELITHETAHQWGAYIGDDPEKSASALILRDRSAKTHWYQGLDTDHDILGGADWEDNGDGTYTILPYTAHCSADDLRYPLRYSISLLSDLTLYLIGAKTKQEVSPLLWLPYEGNERAVGTTTTPSSSPRTITIDEIIARHGERQCLPRTTPSEEELKKTEEWRKFQF